MYCVVCQNRFQSDHLLFCNGCQKTMCRSCALEHNHMFERLDVTDKSQRAHEVANVHEMQRFFDAWSSSGEEYKCVHMHDENAEYFCEVCSVQTCHACTSTHHRHHKVTKMQKYNAQLQIALRGCEEMLSKKEKQLKIFLEQTREGQAYIRNQLRHQEELIAKTSEEILVRFAMALRRQEHLLHRECCAQYREEMDHLIGTTENSECLVKMLKQARKVVKDMRTTKQLPFRQDPFQYLAAINKFKTDSFRVCTASSKGFNQTIKTPTDDELTEICSKIFNQASPNQKQAAAPGGLRRSKSLTSLTSYESTHQEDMDTSNSQLRDFDDDLTSIGETDQELGEFYFTGGYKSDKIPKKMKRSDEIRMMRNYYDVHSNGRMPSDMKHMKNHENNSHHRNEYIANNRVRFCIHPKVDGNKENHDEVSRSIYAKSKPPTGKMTSSGSSASSSSMEARYRAVTKKLNVDRGWSPEITNLRSQSDVREPSLNPSKTTNHSTELRSSSAGNINSSSNQKYPHRPNRHTATRIAHV